LVHARAQVQRQGLPRGDSKVPGCTQITQGAGVAAPDVAERAGRSVEVLLRMYAECRDEGEGIANKRIDAALRDA
jgi:hypothetical protein